MANTIAQTATRELHTMHTWSLQWRASLNGVTLARFEKKSFVANILASHFKISKEKIKKQAQKSCTNGR